MTKLNKYDKEALAKIIREDLSLVNREIGRQLKDLWERFRLELEDELGIVASKKKIEGIEKKIEELQSEVSKIQSSIQEYNNHPGIQDYIDAGIDPPDHRNGWIYNHNREFFGTPVTTIMDVKIVKRIKSVFDIDKPIMMLNEIAQSAYRALIMAGTFEEAQAAYKTFYDLDFQRYGVKIPRRLEEIKKVEGPNLLSAHVVSAPRLEGPKEPAKEDPK